MTVSRTSRGKWFVHIHYRHPDGRVERIRRTSPVQTKASAQKYELQVRAQLLEGTPAPQKQAPTLAAFAKEYLAYSETNNRARTAREKAATFRRAILPALGAMRLDAIGFRELEKYKASRIKERTCPCCKGTGLGLRCGRCRGTGMLMLRPRYMKRYHVVEQKTCPSCSGTGAFTPKRDRPASTKAEDRGGRPLHRSGWPDETPAPTRKSKR